MATTPRYMDKFGLEYYHNLIRKGLIEYIVGTQTEETNAWTGNSTSPALFAGKVIIYHLPFEGTTEAATLELHLTSGKTTGAIAVQNETVGAITAEYVAGSDIFMVYTGSVWKCSAVDTTYAPLNNPAFTGTPTAPTAEPGTRTEQIATTEFTTAAVEAETSELATKLNDKADFLSGRRVTAFQHRVVGSIQESDSHIAFPSIAFFENSYFLAYRRATGHMQYDGVIVIKKGESITSLADEYVIRVTGKDCRDPKFVMVNDTLYLFFTARTEDGNNEVRYNTYTDSSWSDSEKISFDGIESVFCGGRPIIYANIFYIPIYSGKKAYIAYGDNLSNLSLHKLSDNGSEASIIRLDDKYMCAVRSANDKSNGMMIQIPNMDDEARDVVTTLPFNCHCPELIMVNKTIMMAYRSNNQSHNFRNYSGELNCCFFNVNGKLLNDCYNLFSGNNTDVGYPSLVIADRNVLIAFYLNFCHRIMIFSCASDEIGFFRGVSGYHYNEEIEYKTSITQYKIIYPLGVRAISDVNLFIPTYTLENLQYNKIFVRDKDDGNRYVEFCTYGEKGTSNLVTRIIGTLIWGTHILVTDYNTYTDDSGKIIAV